MRFLATTRNDSRQIVKRVGRDFVSPKAKQNLAPLYPAHTVIPSEVKRNEESLQLGKMSIHQKHKGKGNMKMRHAE